MQGKVVIVTGAARGMGFATARAFAAAGAKVALWGRTAETLNAAAREIGPAAYAVPCDMADPEAIEAAANATLTRFGRIDALVNNAGISGVECPVLDITAADWDAVMAVNLRGPMLASASVGRQMARQGGGVILHNASIAAGAADGPYAPYSAAKAGLLALMRSQAVELAPLGIRANAVSPGYTATDMTVATLPQAMNFFPRAPQKRLVTPEEVAAAFVFLASDAASGITGTNLVVDGGLTANLYIMETLVPAEQS